MSRQLSVVVALISALVALPALPLDAAAAERWRPQPGLDWQVQFSGEIDANVDVDVFDLDAFETDASLVEALHDDGRRVVYYVNAGAWENWRPDADRYPAASRASVLMAGRASAGSTCDV